MNHKEYLEDIEKHKCVNGHKFDGNNFGFNWCQMCGVLEIPLNAEHYENVKNEEGVMMHDGRFIRPRLIFFPLEGGKNKGIDLVMNGQSLKPKGSEPTSPAPPQPSEKQPEESG